MLASIPSGLKLAAVAAVALVAAAASKQDLHTAIYISAFGACANTVFQVWFSNRIKHKSDQERMMALKDEQIDRLSRRTDRLLDILDRQGIEVRAEDKKVQDEDDA